MCNLPSSTVEQLEETVKQFLKEGRMFTAYDVTVETRQRQKIGLRHQDVAGACHEFDSLRDAVDFGVDHNGQAVKWQRSQRTLPNGNGWAWVYHPAHVDVSTYQFGVVQKPTPIMSISQVKDSNVSDS